MLEGVATWWAAQHPKPDSTALDQLLSLVRWPLLSTESLSTVESAHPSLAGAATLPQLLLEGFRFHSATTSEAKEALRQSYRSSKADALRRCTYRRGMLVLSPLLPEGPWFAPADWDTVRETADAVNAGNPSFPSSFSYVWNIPHFTSLSCLSMYSPVFLINGHPWKVNAFAAKSEEARPLRPSSPLSPSLLCFVSLSLSLPRSTFTRRATTTTIGSCRSTSIAASQTLTRPYSAPSSSLSSTTREK